MGLVYIIRYRNHVAPLSPRCNNPRSVSTVFVHSKPLVLKTPPGPSTLAQNAKFCPQAESGNLCYRASVPDSTVSSGSGDVYFQIQGPASKRWIGLGQGSRMAGANIFVIYANADGTNVTLSPRDGRGHFQPEFNNGIQAALLEGSGIADGRMTANVRCSFPQ